MLYSDRPNLNTHHQLFQILRYMGGGAKVGSKVGGPRPFFVSEFTLVLKLFEHNFVEVSPFMGGGRTSPIFCFQVYIDPQTIYRKFRCRTCFCCRNIGRKV